MKLGWKVQRTVEVPQIQYVDKVVDVPVVKQVQVPMLQTVQRPVEATKVDAVSEFKKESMSAHELNPSVESKLS